VPQLGIVGLPNVGRTTLFNALTGLDAPTAPHPFSTAEPNLGVARAVDPRLDVAARLEGSKKVVHATLDLMDLPAVHRPGGGLDARWLGRLREMDALVIVLRAFTDPAVPDAESGHEPLTQAETLLLDVTLADAEVFARRAERVAKEATSDPSRRGAAEAMARASALLADGEPLRSGSWTEEELGAFADLGAITLRPAVWVVNVDENEEHPDDLVERVSAVVPAGDEVVALSARLEEEGSRLDPVERDELFEGLGLGKGALVTVVEAAYSALGLLSFFTLGPKEARAWTVPRGSTTAVAAGKIHSDMQRGFIRAEIVPIDMLLDAGGWAAAKAAGTVRVEGRDHPVSDGDVMLVRFSV
jgi:ribosome-binding ATPase